MFIFIRVIKEKSNDTNNRKGGKRMKRKLDKQKIYELIGRATTFLILGAFGMYANYKLMIYILDNCITTIR